jgi:hypothetical protein
MLSFSPDEAQAVVAALRDIENSWAGRMLVFTFERDNGSKVTGPIVERTPTEVIVAVTVDANRHEAVAWDSIVRIAVAVD